MHHSMRTLGQGGDDDGVDLCGSLREWELIVFILPCFGVSCYMIQLIALAGYVNTLSQIHTHKANNI